MTDSDFKKIRSIPKAVAIFIPIAIASSFPFLKVNFTWVYNNYPYSHFGTVSWATGLIRLFLLLIYAIMTLCFYTLLPSKKLRISSLSQYGFWIYLLHPYPIIVIKGILER